MGRPVGYSQRTVEIDESNNELVFENGNRVPITNHIFGADGAGSSIRSYIDMKVLSPSYTEPLGHDYKELHIDPGENGDFQLDPNALHIWPREKFMLIALPNMDKSFTCTLFLPVYGSLSFDALSNAKSVIDFFNEHFEDVLPLLDNFPNLFFENPTGKLATIYADHWRHKRHCLLGDAAHAVVPFFGQGMNASFEDCKVLMDCIQKGNGNWSKIFATFSELRKPDADAIASMAIENYIEMRSSVTQSDYIARKKITNALFAKFPDKL